MMRLRNIAIPHWTKLHEIRAQFYGFLGEQLEGTEDIGANGAQNYVMQRFYTFLQRWLPIDRNANLAAYSGWMTNAALVAVGMSLAYGLAGYMWFAGQISIGAAYVIVDYAGMLYSRVAELRGQITDLQHAEAGIGRIQELFNMHSRLTDGHHETLPSGALTVEFNNVSFAYDDQEQTVDNASLLQEDVYGLTSEIQTDTDIKTASIAEQVLHNLDFKLESGKVLGLLGRTGSGKTTLARLILRLYDPIEGQVCLGDVPLTQTSLQDIRQHVALVTQEIQLFQASVRDNLSLFKPDVTDADILAVFNSLGLLDWLQSLPDGLDTELASGGGGLSAGQAQLLAFARVFLANPDLVILDEASSRLDPATEQLIEHALDMLLENRTGIIIAHRLNTVQRADEVLILDDGYIREMGTRAILAEDTTSYFHHLLKTGMAEVLV